MTIGLFECLLFRSSNIIPLLAAKIQTQLTSRKIGHLKTLKIGMLRPLLVGQSCIFAFFKIGMLRHLLVGLYFR